MKYPLMIPVLCIAITFGCFSEGGRVALAEDAVLYKAGTVYTMTGDPISPGMVLVVDGKIKAVGAELELPEGGQQQDLGPDSVLMPGLVNAYSQTALAAGSESEVTDEITPNFKASWALDWDKSDLMRQAMAGTTTMQVCPGTDNVISGVSAVIKTDPGQRMVVREDGALIASMCADPASGNRSRARPDSIYVRQPTNRMGVVWMLRNAFNKAKSQPDLVKLNPVRETLDGKRSLMMVSRLSHDLHTVGVLADEFGFKPVIVGGQEAHKVKDILVERGYPIVLQPLVTGSVRGQERSEVCWNQAGVLAEAGLTIAITGDDLLEQARFAYRFGLDKETALASITSTPAKLLGLEKRVGTLAPGSDADLLVLSGDPLELTTSIRMIVVNGKPVENKED